MLEAPDRESEAARFALDSRSGLSLRMRSGPSAELCRRRLSCFLCIPLARKPGEKQVRRKIYAERHH